jgi:hypothetical protein
MSGRVRLAVTGIQDQWLTGEPQFSYFLTLFRRHSKFALEQIESPFDGKIDFGEILECRVPQNKGDLIKNISLKITLSDPTPDESNSINNVVYVPSVCTELIEYAELLIGGQTIERITGEYIFMHQQLYNNDDDVAQSLYFLNGHGNYLGYRGDYTYFIDLPFFFYRYPNLSIPICALTKQLVEVRVKLHPLNKIVRDTKNNIVPTNVTASIKNISMDTEFVFVGNDEKNYLLTRPLEYVITQLQMSQFTMPYGLDTKSVMLKFQHPVKEMYFVAQNDYYTSNNLPLNFEKIDNVELKFNDNQVFNADHKFITYQQPFAHHTNSPTVLGVTAVNPIFGVYSFAERPQVEYPTGQVNMSRVYHKLFTVKLDSTTRGTNTIRVYAKNYNVLRIQSGLAGLKF